MGGLGIPCCASRHYNWCWERNRFSKSLSAPCIIHTYAQKNTSVPLHTQSRKLSCSEACMLGTVECVLVHAHLNTHTYKPQLDENKENKVTTSEKQSKQVILCFKRKNTDTSVVFVPVPPVRRCWEWDLFIFFEKPASVDFLLLTLHPYFLAGRTLGGDCQRCH